MPSSEGQMINAMGSLAATITQLDAHLRDSSSAGVQRGVAASNAAQVAQYSQVAQPIQTAAANAPVAAQVAQQNLAAVNARRDAAGTPAPDRSTPPGVDSSEQTDSRHDNLQNPDTADSLMYSILGEQGGPFGKLRTRQYMMNRQLGWAQSVANTMGSWGGDYSGPASGALGGAAQGASSALSSVIGVGYNKETGSLNGTGLGLLGGYLGLEKAADVAGNFRTAGQQLGYGNQGNLSMGFGLNNPFAQTSATSEGFSLEKEKLGLEGRLPSSLFGGPGLGNGILTSGNAQQAVGVLAGQGFSNQAGTNFVNGDNTRIATNLIAPLMNMGLTAQNAAQWTPALRNANTSMQTLMDTLNLLPAAAKATKLPLDQLNASLEQTAQVAVSQGGTLQSGAQMGMAFTEATGMAPAIGSAISQNPLYQGFMAGTQGVLPSGVANLPGGTQVQGMLSVFNMLRGMTSGLNKNKFETVGGVKLPTQYGYQMQDSQIAEMMGVDQSTVNRLRQEASAPRRAQIQGQLGNWGSQGQPGTGIYDILGQAQSWGGLTAAQRGQATRVWNSTFDSGQGLGLSSQQLKAIQSTSNVREKVKDLNSDLLGDQAKSKQNQVTVYVKFKGNAAKYLEQDGKSYITLAANSGGSLANGIYNSPMGDALLANGSTPNNLIPVTPMGH